MKPQTELFKQKSVETLHDVKIQENLSGLYSGFHEERIKVTAETENWYDAKGSCQSSWRKYIYD